MIVYMASTLDEIVSQAEGKGARTVDWPSLPRVLPRLKVFRHVRYYF